MLYISACIILTIEDLIIIIYYYYTIMPTISLHNMPYAHDFFTFSSPTDITPQINNLSYLNGQSDAS